MVSYRAVIYWKERKCKDDFLLNSEFTVKKFAIKAIFDYFINQLFEEFIHYNSDNPDRMEENRREIKQNYGKFFEYIDDYQFKYVMDLEEMWNNRLKEGGYDYWIYEDLYDAGGMLYDIEKIDRYAFLRDEKEKAKNLISNND